MLTEVNPMLRWPQVTYLNFSTLDISPPIITRQKDNPPYEIRCN